MSCEDSVDLGTFKEQKGPWTEHVCTTFTLECGFSRGKQLKMPQVLPLKICWCGAGAPHRARTEIHMGWCKHPELGLALDLWLDIGQMIVQIWTCDVSKPSGLIKFSTCKQVSGGPWRGILNQIWPHTPAPVESFMTWSPSAGQRTFHV